MKQIRLALIYAVIMIGAGLAMGYADHLGLREPADDRIFGVVMGLILSWFGNMMPKQEPGNCGECGVSRGQNMRRFAGWMFTLAGLAYSAIWLLAPLDQASMLSMIVVGGAMVIVIGRATIARSWV